MILQKTLDSRTITLPGFTLSIGKFLRKFFVTYLVSLIIKYLSSY